MKSVRSTRSDPRRPLHKSPTCSGESGKRLETTQGRKILHPGDSLSQSLKGLETLLDADDSGHPLDYSEQRSEHEFSFSKDHIVPGSRSLSQVPAPTSSSGNSTTSTKEVNEVAVKIETLLKSVNTQLTVLEGKRNSGPYSSSMALKKVKDKLQGMATLDRLLTEKRSLIEDQEKQLAVQRTEMMLLQAQLEERTNELNIREQTIDEYIPRIQLLEQEVSEARKLLRMYQTQEVTKDGLSRSVDKSLPRLTEIESELKKTASLLETRTYELIREERESQIKEQELSLKLASLLAAQSQCAELKAELTAKERNLETTKVQVDSQLRKLRSTLVRQEADSALDFIMRKVIGEVEDTCLAQLEKKKDAVTALQGDLELEISRIKDIKMRLEAQVSTTLQFQTNLFESKEKLSKREALLDSELALLKAGKTDLLFKKREEAIVAKEKSFNEKLKKLKESQQDVKLQEERAQEMVKEGNRLLEQAQIKEPSTLVPKPTFESLKSNPGRADLELAAKEAVLQAKEEAFLEREKLLTERESHLKELNQSVSVKQEKLKTLWASLASAANAIGRSKETSYFASPPSEFLEDTPKPEGPSILNLSSIEATDSSELLTFTESFRVRRQELIEHFADVEREKREMSETLKEFLGDDCEEGQE